MSLRGRVIRRRNVSCYLKPESIQEQMEKFAELAKAFRVRFYRNATDRTAWMSRGFGELGYLGTFPYPELITGVLATNCPPDNPYWMRVEVPITFTANSVLEISPERGDVHRCVVFVTRNGAELTLSKTQYLKPLSDTGEAHDCYCNESIIAGDNGKMYVTTTSAMTQGNVALDTPCDRWEIDIPPGDTEVYAYLFGTQDDILVDSPYNNFAYTYPVTAERWIKANF